MTRSPRRHPQLALLPARMLGGTTRLLIAALATLSCSGLAFAVLAPVADAKVVTVETATPGEEVTVGVQDRNAAYIGELGDEPLKFNNESGKPVMHSANTYGIYWDPEANYDGDWQEIINQFLSNLGDSEGNFETDFAVDGQYRDSTNKPATTKSSYHGSYTDTSAYPPAGCTDPKPFTLGAVTCLTDAQVRSQLEAFIAEHGLPKGMGTIYYLLTPPGVTICLDAGGPTGHCSDHTGGIPETEEAEKEASSESYRNSFCSYHGAITASPETGDANTILYGMIPWTAGTVGVADLAPSMKSYDCQDGGFDPSSKPTAGEKEKAKGEEKKKAEAKEEGELEEAHQKCRVLEKEVEGKPEEAEVKANCAKKIEEIEKKGAKAIEKAEEEEANEGPRIQEPHQLPKEPDLDGDYDPGLADVITNQLALEQQNIVTDPLTNAWHDPKGNEVTDECRNDFWTPEIGGASTPEEFTHAGTLTNQGFNGGNYYIQDVFLLSGNKLDYPGGGTDCQSFVNLFPHFTAPSVVNSGEIVGFDGMESAISLDWAGLGLNAPIQTYATYSWNFGDGTPEVSGYAPGAPTCTEPWLSPCAASVFHSYQYGGTYTVTLTVHDTGGNSTFLSREVTVDGPAKPSTGGGGGGGGGSTPGGGGSTSGGASTSGSTSAGGGSTSGGGSTTPATVPAPTARAAAASTSLRNALRHGLTIRYAVNEQVAGTVDVLVNASIARRLHLRGPVATGLPAGYPRSIVIGHAVLVTRTGGNGAVRLKLSRSAQKALRKVHKVTLALRIVVRNASRTNPTSTSLLSSFVLHR